MRNPVECKDRVVNIAGSAAINTFYSACRRRGGVLNSPRFCFFFFFFYFFSVSEVGAALMGDTAGTNRVSRPKHGLNSISSEMCQQNTHLNVHARTSKPQEGFTCKDSHAKCFKTTNSSDVSR